MNRHGVIPGIFLRAAFTALLLMPGAFREAGETGSGEDARVIKDAPGGQSFPESSPGERV